MNLVEAYERGLDAYLASHQRDDWKAPHSSHLGHCLYKTWMSRSGFEKLPMSVQEKSRLVRGLHDEEHAIYTLMEKLEADSWECSSPVVTDGLVGHSDLVLTHMMTGERRLVEIKTTEFKFSAANKKPASYMGGTLGPYHTEKFTHRLQALDYALQLGIKYYCIFTLDNNRRMPHQYPAPGEWFDADDEHWKRIHKSWRESVIHATDPEKDPVESGAAVLTLDGRVIGDPPEPWQCEYCPYAQCSRNSNPANPFPAETPKRKR